MERRAPLVLAWILFLLGTLVGQDDVFRTKGRVAPAAIQDPTRSSVAPAKNRPSASSAQKTQALANYSRLPLSFEPNHGQAGSAVKYLARGGQFNVFLTKDELAFGFARRHSHRRSVFDMEDSAAQDPPEFSCLELRLVGANPSSPVWGEEQLGGTVNYLVGRDPSQWHVNLPTFAKVRYRNVYPGVDLLYYGNQGELESDFIIAPGANPEAVKLSVVGAEAITIAASGDLVLRMKDGELRLRKPLVYQTVGTSRKEIAGGYVLAGDNQVGFRVERYDHKQPLIIDPVLSYSTYLGGDGFDEATAIAVDSAGNAYITGDTTSTNFPTTLGPATGDMFVAKLSPTGTKLYATYVGGTAQLDFPTGIGVDLLSNAYVVGQTGETNLPTTAGALRTTFQGGAFDGFVFSLNPAGTGFNYFTYLGGSAFDLLAAVAVDSLGNAYITGQTDSGDYPTLNPFEPLAAAGDGGIITTTNSGTNWTASATGLVNRNIAVVAVDPKTPTTIYAATLESGVIKSTNSGAAWNAINTGLTSLVIQALVVDPVTPANVYVGTGRGGVFVSNNGGTSWATMNAGLVGINVHALAIDPTSPGTLYASTGGNGVFKFASGAWSATGVLPQDVATAIVVDPTNNQNVYASFQSSGVYRSSNGGTSWAAFNTGLSSLQVAALAIDHGGHLYAGTRNGGVFLSTSGGNWAAINTGLPLGVFQALATDPTNNTTVYVGTWNGGVYRSTNNGASWSEAANNGLNNVRVSTLAVDPLTPANLYAGSQNVEAVVTKLSPSGALVFSSYLGGGGGEAGLGIAVDGDNGNLYVAGFTNSLNFPTVAAAQASMVGGISGFVSKVKSDGSGLVYSTYLGGPLSSSSGSLDQASAIAADTSGNAYVTGITNSTGFPVANATQAALSGASDGFVVKYNASGQKLFATYLGGEGTDAGNAITATANADGSTSAWIAGQTTSNFFPLANPIQLERGNQNSASNAGFISDFNFPASGAAPTLAFSTYLGTGCGTGCDTVAQAIGHDGTNNIYVAGRTMSNSFPAVNAVQNILAGPQNAFIAKIGATTSNADLSLTLNSFAPTTIVAGALVTFSLTVTNNGPNDAPNVSLGGRGGNNLNLVTCTATQGVCGNNLQVIDRGFAELGTLASGTSATIAGTLQPLSACGVAGAPACPFLIEVDARSDANDPNPSNNSATTNLTVLPGADLAVTLSAAPSPAPVQVGGTLNYIANVSNLGPSNASNVSAVFALVPATAATFVSLPTGCTNSAPGTLTCVLGPMPAGTAGLDTIPVTVNSLPITAEIVVSNTPEADPDPSNNSASVTTALSASSVNNAELNGQYAFLLRGFDPSGKLIAIAGSFTADGAGHITGGVLDINDAGSTPCSPSASCPLTINAAPGSFYSVGADNRGTLTLTTSAGTETFDFSVGSISSGVASLGHIISRQSASATNGSAISGVFKKQDATAFTLAALNGDWAFLNEGVDGSGGRFANAGRFTLSAGNITNGSEDFNDNGVFDNGTTTALTITGSLGSVDTNGRVPLTAGSGTPGHTAVYIVSANEALSLSVDPSSANPLASGSVLRQNTAFCPTTGNCNFTNSALNGNAVAYVQGNSSSGVAGASDVSVGVLTFTLATTSYSGGFDENDGGTIYCPAGNICANPGGSIASGNYSVASNGRVTLTETGEGHAPFFYMVNTNQAFLIGTSSSHVETGMAENQAGPITPGSFGSAFGTEPPAVSGSLMFSGVQTITAAGSTTASLTSTTNDVNSVGPIPDITRGGLHEDVSVADDVLTLDPTTGRFTFASGTRVGYFINANKRVAIDIETTSAAPYVIISDNQSSSISAEPDLAVGLAANPSTGVFVGGPITYTVTVSNARSTPATGVVLTTVLLPSLTVNSVTPSQGSCAVGASPVASFTCSLGTVSQGTPVTVTIVAVAPASGTACGSSALGCIIVAADVSENEIDFNPADNTNSVTTPVLAPIIDLALTKAHTGSFTIGNNGVYSLTVTNVGNTATTGTITVSDTLPTGLGFVSGAGTGWNCSAASQVVTCTNPGPIAGNNGSSTVTLTVSVAPAAVPSVTNTASVSTPGDNNPANDTASDPTTIIGEPDLSVSIGATRVSVGAPITFTVTANNLLSTSATGVSLSTTLSPSLIVNRVTPSQGGSCVNLPTLPANIGPFTCNWVAVGAPATVTVTAVAPASGNACAGSALGCVTVTSSVTENETDFNPTNNSASVVLPIVAAVSPSGHFVYTNDDRPSSNTVSGFIAASDGTLTPIAGSPFVTGGAGQGGALFAANRIGVAIVRNFLFASNAGSSDVSVFIINPSTGALTLVAGSPFATGVSGDFNGIAVSPTPDGNFLMAANNGSTSSITVFSIGSTGALTPITGSPFTTLGIPDGIKISPDGKFLSVAEFSPTQVEMFSIASNGSLASLGVFAGAGGGNGVGGVDINCGTNFLYAGEFNASSKDIVDGYSIAANGTLTPVPGSPFVPAAGGNSNVVLLSPDDKTLFVSNQASSTITAFTVASNGSLSLLAGSPFSMNGAVVSPSGMATSQDGSLLYVADPNFGSALAPTVSVFSVASNGALTEVAGSPFSTGQPSGLESLAAYPPKTCGVTPLVSDLAVAMTASPAPVPVLGSVTYQITVTNNGPSPATGVVLTDTLPAGTMFASIDDLTDCRVSNGTLTCNFGALAVGSANSRTVNLILVPLAVPSGAGTFDNTVSVVANETDPTPSNNSATQTVQVTGTTLPGGGAFRNLPGFSTNILPGNDDNSTGSVPMNLTLNFFGVQVSSVFVNNNGNVTFDSALGTFTPFDLTSTGQQIIAPYFSDVETDFPTSGQVTYGNDTVNGRPAFGVNWPNVEYCCSSDPSKLNLFQLVLVDRSDVGAGNFDIEFNYDKIQWETGDASNGVGGLGGFSARAGYSNGSQTAGSFFELPGSGVPGSFLDTNTTAGLIYNDLNSTQPGRYVFQVRGGTVQSSADLAISANGPPSAATGSTITYTLTATNLGPNTATGVTVTDTLPAGFTFVSVTPSNICSPAGQPVVVTCNVGSLANGSNAVITIQAGIPTTASGTATDTAVVSVPNNQDLNLGNNTATAVTNITVLAPDLIISKTHTGNFVQGQTGATYTITVTNSGTGATTATVTVNDILPAGLTATAISGTGWTCTSLTSCNRVDTLPAGASYPPITLTVDVAANAPSQVTNTATVSGGGEVNTANDTANDLTNIGVAAADLAVTVAVVPPADASGTTVSYAVTITNNGPSAATSVTLTDQLVGNASFASANSSTMTCPAPSASSLACTQAVLDNGASAVVNITVNLAGAGWDGNTVHATSPVPDPNPINNAAPVQKQLAGGNTGTGSDVAVQPVDSTSGASPAVLTFASVTRGGTTALASAASGPAPPAGLRTGTPAVFYNLTTTAGYAGTISVALGFNGVSFHHPANVRLFHYENGAWVDRTVAVNPTGAYTVAQVTSLSPFALFEPINHVPDAKAGPDLTTAATSTQGAKVTLNGSASFDADHDLLTYRWTGPFPEGNGVVTGVNPTVTMPLGASRVTLVVNDSEADSALATQSITVTNFSMAAAAAGPTTISAGGSVSFHISASPQFGPFPSAVSLACLGLPQGAQCNFSTTTVNAGGAAATLTISTTPRTAAVLAPVHHRSPAPLYTLWMPLPAIALMGLGLRRRSRKRAAALMLLLLLGMMLLLVSCGGGSIGVTPQPQNGTPAGTFTVTVTGTASGSLQHTTTVTFTVQ